jgi:hypothetical protein
LFDTSRAALWTSSAGRAKPDIFAFYLGQTERGLPDYFSNAELPDPVPRTNRIAQSALKAISEGFSASLFYLFYYLFKGGDCFHCLY